MHIEQNPIRGHRALVAATGERISEEHLVQTLLATGSFANRPSVEREVSQLFGVLEDISQYLKEKRNATEVRS